jgi:2-polyprenyl-3-methyl-5-hydroxy-6-metoxy-1,4-benzoquinol methylase
MTRALLPTELAMKIRRRLAGGSGAVEALRATWSRYPGDWERDAALSMGATMLGDEWGGPAFADLVIELVAPYVGADVDVLELGCGGGKFSGRLAPRCRSLVCSDISEQMIERTRATLRQRGLDTNVDYRVLNGVDFTGVPDESVDFIFSYDVQLHLQPQNVFSYMRDARRVLRDNGVFMLHQINLASEGGMEHFVNQYHGGAWKLDLYHPRRRGFVYFMSGDQMRALADAARLLTLPILDDFPAKDSALRHVTNGRDLIGFFRLMPSRLRGVRPDSVRLVRAEGGPTVYAVVNGQRMAFASARQFDLAGFRMEQIEQLPAADMTELPEADPLAPWE